MIIIMSILPSIDGSVLTLSPRLSPSAPLKLPSNRPMGDAEFAQLVAPGTQQSPALDLSKLKVEADSEANKFLAAGAFV
jgi:hypothetical protein